MENSVEKQQMTSDTKKPSSPKPIRVVDPQDQVWSSLQNLTAGLSPEERSKKLRAFVNSVPAAKKS